ncbi:MAG TPA: hypothetical protein VGD46_17745 [Rhizobacter sp.]
MHRVIHLQPEAPSKPGLGQACNGCGVCCTAEPCPVGMLVSRRRTGPCDALVWSADEKRYRCAVASEPGRFVTRRWMAQALGRAARRLIAAGQGCDCDLTVETA